MKKFLRGLLLALVLPTFAWGAPAQLTGKPYDLEGRPQTPEFAVLVDQTGAYAASGGGGGTSSTFSAAFPATGTAIGAKNGANMVFLAADSSNNLDVNCIVGCAGGALSNASDAVATTSTNAGTNAYNFGFNGTTWDRLQVDASKFLKVTIAASAASNISMNEAQVSGTAVSVNNGVTDAGTQRVSLSSDSTGQVKLATGANTIGALTANQSVNQAQVSGTAVSVNNGVVDAGTTRVTLASNGTGVVGLAAGANIIGKVGIDQTTDVTTNGVEIAPTAAAAAGITPVVSASLESGHILKASGGNLYSVSLTTDNAATGYLMIFNSATVPADGAVTPIECVPVQAISTVTINPGQNGPPEAFSTGISVAYSSTGCFTKTATVHGFFNGKVK